MFGVCMNVSHQSFAAGSLKLQWVCVGKNFSPALRSQIAAYLILIYQMSSADNALARVK